MLGVGAATEKMYVYFKIDAFETPQTFSSSSVITENSKKINNS